MDREHNSRYVRVRLKRSARPKLQETAEGSGYCVNASRISQSKTIFFLRICRSLLEKFSTHKCLSAYISDYVSAFLPHATSRCRWYVWVEWFGFLVMGAIIHTGDMCSHAATTGGRVIIYNANSHT